MSRWIQIAFLSVLLFGSVAFFIWPQSLAFLSALIDEQSVVGYSVYVLLLVIATVFAPVTFMPLVPVAAQVFGPFLTGVLSIIGWMLGAIIAFWVARTFGRPLLSRFGLLQKVEEFVLRLPKDTRFTTLILIRMVIPVDISSYALGLVKSISFVEYFFATLIGISYFSFAFAYLSTSLVSHQYGAFSVLAAVSLSLFIGGWVVLRRHLRDTNA